MTPSVGTVGRRYTPRTGKRGGVSDGLGLAQVSTGGFSSMRLCSNGVEEGLNERANGCKTALSNREEETSSVCMVDTGMIWHCY